MEKRAGDKGSIGKRRQLDAVQQLIVNQCYSSKNESQHSTMFFSTIETISITK